ncbi:MAG: GNAT family N-acetyltransferase [Caldilinea sp.]
MTELITLMPLDPTLHTGALQAVFAATPSYWQLYKLDAPPADHAAKEFAAVQETPGRSLLGILRRIDRNNPDAGAELIGVLDFQLHYPQEGAAYIGLLLVAEPLQRQGIGAQAWSLLKPWLASAAGIHTVRVGVEQFNVAALKFWEAQGFTLTGESDRVRIGEKFIRLLYMTAALAVE